MAPSPRDRLSVDLHGLKAALLERAQALSMTPSGLVRTTLAEALGQSAGIDGDRPMPGQLPHNHERVRLCLRMSREQAQALLRGARHAGMNPGDYIGDLMLNVPVLSAGGCRSEHI